jgi:hypothetical protein
VDDVEAGLKGLLETHRGHLAVSDTGELLYSFDPRLIQRGSEPFWARTRRLAYSLFAKGFKVWIVAMLVLYFIAFLALIVAAVVASQSRDGAGGRRGGWGRGRGHGRLPLGDLAFLYWIWGPRWRLGRPYYGRRWERTLPQDDRVPFYKKVFAFVFGPDEVEPTRAQRDRDALRLIRARRGVVTAPELVQLTALPRPAVEEELGRLVGSYGGEAVVSPRGELAYAFPGLLLSAHGRVRVREPGLAWQRLEHPKELTGNTAGANAVVVGINAFNLLAAASAPWFIFPRLGIGGPLAFAALVVIPLVFSFLFFAVPGMRMLGVKRENRRRAGRNARRVLLGLIFQDALERGRGVTEDEARAHVSRLLGQLPDPGGKVSAELHALAAELDADVLVGPNGETVFRFDKLRTEVEEGERVRRSMALAERQLGEVVYSTEDSATQQTERDLAAFDRALATTPESSDVAHLTSGADKIGFRDEWEAVPD